MKLRMMMGLLLAGSLFVGMAVQAQDLTEDYLDALYQASQRGRGDGEDCQRATEGGGERARSGGCDAGGCAAAYYSWHRHYLGGERRVQRRV